MSVRLLLILLPVAVALSVATYWFYPRGPSAAVVASAYATSLPPVSRPLRVFHLGHSLVGRDMPAMLAQLAGPGHAYESQLGSGTTLKEHWEPDLAIRDFDIANDGPRFRPAREAVGSGQYDAVIVTEMIELSDAIRYFDSAAYLSRWANLARGANPDTQVYLYETWAWLDDEQGWLKRLDLDLTRYWENGVLLPDLLANGTERPVRVIPAGQVMARFVRAIEAVGGVDNVTDRYALFAVDRDGKQDLIHMSDLGAYLVALTHYAVLYRRSPVGLPYQLNRADGSAADAPGPKAARLMQDIVWEVVTSYAKTGVAS
jgi:hypothetical protein